MSKGYGMGPTVYRPNLLIIVIGQGFWYFAEKKPKFRGIFRGKFTEKSADFTGFSRKKVNIREKIGRFCRIFAGEKSNFAEKAADFAGF